VIYKDGLRYGRRNGFLTDLIPYKLTKEQLEKYEKLFKESFFKAETIFSKRHEELSTIFAHIESHVPGLKSANIYGELFGGRYDGKTGATKAVQL
jgi:hypothetical protein